MSMRASGAKSRTISSRTTRLATGSTPDSGSSSRKRRARLLMTRAMCSFSRIPFDISRTGWCSTSPKRSTSSPALARSKSAKKWLYMPTARSGVVAGSRNGASGRYETIPFVLAPGADPPMATRPS